MPYGKQDGNLHIVIQTLRRLKIITLMNYCIKADFTAIGTVIDVYYTYAKPVMLDLWLYKKEFRVVQISNTKAGEFTVCVVYLNY